MDLEPFLARVAEWARGAPNILGLALCGSHARGEARPDSDVDLVLIARSPERLLEDRRWIDQFGAAGPIGREDYGLVQSLRVQYAGGFEVEFGIAGPVWRQSPIDPGTAGVIAAGLRILYDPNGALEAAVREVQDQRSADQPR